ncbi:hypothetical protein FSP39_014470 [Pinctada imbricata]|uniref:Uncharacterized protein n=1 Tax=Pinctada imbricata TaxID=66713 RepID=A0AA88XYW1_PINIB|nr:hypothetical protein FSP39_014470 [Pinctada imbricata]
MLKPIDGCPTGFKEGIIKQTIRGTGTSDIYHLDSENGMIYFTHKFCTKPKTTEQEATAQWGRGQYCILSYGGSCPDGFKDGVVGFDNMQKPEVLKHPIPDSQHDKNLVLHVCCREDGSWKDPLILPTKEAFVLFQKGDECQEVKDMMSSSEWFLIDNDFTGLDKIEGLVPEIEVIRASKYYIGICYYWPINYSMTYTYIYFSIEFNSPVGSHVELDFQSFDIELREDDSCGDSLEVRTGLPGQLGINYCGDTFKPTVMSEQNYLGLIFTSGPEVTKRGFKAKLSVIRRLCYDKFYDCYQLQQTNAQFCSSSNHSAKFGCRKTCGFCAKRHSKAGKTNNCAFVDKNGLWVGTSCNAAKYIAVICKFSPSERMVCADAHPNCARILEREQSACMAYPEFSWHLCPQSCAVCKRGPEIKCARPLDGQNTVELTGKREVTVGRMFEYRCKKGYIHSEGNLRRVCLKSGKLSGDIPKCISEHSIPTANNAIELRQRRQDGRDGTAYVGLNDAQRIPKNGLLVRWMFYSIYDGEVALQVWRKLPGSGRKIKLKLIGQTVVSNTKDHRVHTVSLAPKSHQIVVKEGDYIGFFLPTENKGGMTFDKCNSDIDGAYYGHQYSANGENANNWRLGGSYLFSKDKMSCKKVSLTAYVL